MSFQWTDADRRFEADVDDMVQDFDPADLPGLAQALDRGDSRLPTTYAGRVAAELRARAAAGSLFRSGEPRLASEPGAPDIDDEIPW